MQMFYLSKFAWAILQPSNFIAILLALGLVLLALRKRTAALRLIVAATALYIIAAFSPLATWLLHPLEHHTTAGTERDVAGASGIIVLGGSLSGAIPTPGGAVSVGPSSERVTEALRLALKHPELPVIFSGGNGSVLQSADAELNEARAAERFFESFGIAPPRLRLEDRSRNTLENATFSAAMLRPKPDQRWILVTSAFHMRRAAALFEAQGFRVVPWPVGSMTSGRGDLEPFGSGSDGLRHIDIASKEWLGLFVSWLRGDLTPAPHGGNQTEASRVSGS